MAIVTKVNVELKAFRKAQRFSEVHRDLITRAFPSVSEFERRYLNRLIDRIANQPGNEIRVLERLKGRAFGLTGKI